MTFCPRIFTAALDISIHILAWRMTRRYQSGATAQGHFNPHPRTEDDMITKMEKEILKYFNPHPRTEDDGVADVLGILHTISIHILARRMTR